MSWPAFWSRKEWRSVLLWPLSKVVAFEAKRRLQKFELSRQKQAYKAQVIVVGNLTVGGSGKTPLILWLTQSLQVKGLKVGIVSRGYGGQSQTWPLMVTPDSNPQLVGDEPVLLAKQLNVPIAVGPKRVQALELIEKETPCDIIISDDGLQHFGLQRDIELVVVDSERQFGNQWCMPAGPLREPLSRISKVDGIVMNGGGAPQLPSRLLSGSPQAFAMQLVPVVFRNVLNPEQTLSVEAFRNKQVNSLAGIGNPQRFFDTLNPLVYGQTSQAFNDHQYFVEDDLKVYLGEKPLIMTAKDAVKCAPIAQKLHAENWWALEVTTEVEDELMTLILQKLRS